MTYGNPFPDLMPAEILWWCEFVGDFVALTFYVCPLVVLILACWPWPIKWLGDDG